MKKSAAANFVPFEPTPASPPAPESGPRLKVVPKPENRPDFAPLADPASTAGPSTVASPALAAHAAHASRGHANAAPVITLERDGDRVTSIRIECLCGQVIEVACSY